MAITDYNFPTIILSYPAITKIQKTNHDVMLHCQDSWRNLNWNQAFMPDFAAEIYLDSSVGKGVGLMIRRSWVWSPSSAICHGHINEQDA